jgi:hypothetical protein
VTDGTITQDTERRDRRDDHPRITCEHCGRANLHTGSVSVAVHHAFFTAFRQICLSGTPETSLGGDCSIELAPYAEPPG